MSSFLPVGKLPDAKLNAVLQRLPRRDPRVVLGPRLGEDVAVLDLNDRYLVVASDPVTFASDRIGWYVVHINANDVAVLGAKPRWFMAVVLLPEGTSMAELAARIMADVANTCDALDVNRVWWAHGDNCRTRPSDRDRSDVGRGLTRAPGAKKSDPGRRPGDSYPRRGHRGHGVVGA